MEGPLGRAHRRPSVHARHTIAVRQKETCKANSAIAGGRHHEDMHAIYLAGSVSYTYLCDVGFKNCKSKSELGHRKYEKHVLQFACLMQTGSNGCEIYKNVRMMHAVVFADRAPEAKKCTSHWRKSKFQRAQKAEK